MSEAEYNNAVTASEGQRQADIRELDAGNPGYQGLGPYKTYDEAALAAAKRHWQRVLDAAKANGMTNEPAATALVQSGG